MSRLNNKGITLIVLIITVIVLIIIASISITEGKKLVDEAKVENLITDMITIKSKARVYEEEVESKTWDLSNDIKEGTTISEKEQGRQDCFTGEDYKFLLVTNDNAAQYNMQNLFSAENIYYALSKEALDKMGLGSLWENGSYYVVKYTVENNKYEGIDVIYTKGIKYKSNMYYSLSQLQEVLGNV